MPDLRVAVLVDLPRERAAGGHVKYWERLAQAAVKENAPVDLTIYFSGTGADEVLSPRVRFRFLPPVFSTARLKFLPYVPAHTDLAPFHPKLAKELPDYDVLHTTDGFFAFARTAERVACKRGLPLVTSFHTDTPAYAELFTRQTLQSLLGRRFGNWIDFLFKISARERRSKEKRLKTHLRACSAILAMRPEDIALAQSAIAQTSSFPQRQESLTSDSGPKSQLTTPQKPPSIRHVHLGGVDKDLFAPNPKARAGIEREYKIAPGKFLTLFVGRVDAGKNMPLLMQACAQAIEKGANLHLVVVGLGPMCDEVKATLGDNATLAGWLPPEKLAQLYAAADCLSMASDIEIGGMIGLEALSCGCPVLVSKQSGVASLCGNTPAMHVIESSSEAWANALTALAQDQSKQTSMREAAQTFRRDNLAGWTDVLNTDFLPVWQSITRKSPRL